MFRLYLSVRSRFSGENLMHFTVLSLFKLFACSKSFNVLLLTNMEKKVQRVQTMIYTSAVVFVPYLDVEKRFLQHSIMAQSCMFGSTTMGQQDYFCSKNLWSALRRTFSVVFKSLHHSCQIYNLNYSGKKIHHSNIAY